MLNNQSIKTRLTKNLKAKNTKVMHTQKQGERKKNDKITWSPFPSTP